MGHLSSVGCFVSFIFLFLFFNCVVVLPACVSIHHMCNAQGDKKKALDFLEPELSCEQPRGFQELNLGPLEANIFNH